MSFSLLPCCLRPIALPFSTYCILFGLLLAVNNLSFTTLNRFIQLTIMGGYYSVSRQETATLKGTCNKDELPCMGLC